MTHNRTPEILSATTIIEDEVVNLEGEEIGYIRELMFDLAHGRVAYAVLSFHGFLGLGDKLFAVPWPALKLDAEKKRFILDVDRETLEKAPGFNPDAWPEPDDYDWYGEVFGYWGYDPYWG